MIQTWNWKKWLSQNKLLSLSTAILILLAVIVRVAWLSQIPAAFSHDELDYIINAQSVYLTGVGRTGEWQPFSLKPVEPTLSELPSLFLAPTFYLPFSNAVNLRLPFVMMTLTIPIFVGLITYYLTRSKSAAYFSWVLGLFNPWLWQMSRLTFDSVFSIWFYLIGVVIFFYTKRYQKLWSLVPFFLGFYCYQGFKLLLPLVVGLIVLHYFWSISRQLRQWAWWRKQLPVLLVLFLAGGLFLYYFSFQFSQQADSQNKLSAQLLLPSSEVIGESVKLDRRMAVVTPLNELFINKYVKWFGEFIGRYLTVFGGRELFFSGDPGSSSFSVWSHGIFYLLDALLLFVGLYELAKHQKKGAIVFVLLWLVIGGLPSAINQNIWLFFRSALIIPAILISTGVGAAKIWKQSQPIFIFLACLYCASVVYFGLIYFVRYPIYGAENIFFSPRLLANYISRVTDQHKVVVYDNEPKFTFTSYLFYNNLFTKDTAQSVHKQFEDETYTLNNVTFEYCIPNEVTFEEDTIYIVRASASLCDDGRSESAKDLLLNNQVDFNPAIFIKAIKDSGSDFAIYGDNICDYQKLPTYVYPQNLSDLSVQNLSNQRFCEVWLSKEIAE